jgi:uncharacterized tellurite resistance protein B-like protein
MMNQNVNQLNTSQKKVLLALIYNVLVSDQDYAPEEKYLFNNLIDYIDVPFNFNIDMMSKHDIISYLKKLPNSIIDIYLDVVRLAILADGVISEDELTFFKDVFLKMNYSAETIQEKLDFLKFGDTL